MPRTLVLVRHAKSDWSFTGPDLERPIGKRGRRQAGAIGPWLLGRQIMPQAVVTSTAVRARQTWALIAGSLTAAGVIPPEAAGLAQAYTFSGTSLLGVVRDLPGQARTALIVGHNPAMQELTALLTGELVPMTTSSVAVIGTAGPWAGLGDGGAARLLWAGRPVGQLSAS